MAILVVAKHNNQHLDESTAKTVSAAAKLGDEIHVLVAGNHCKSAAEEAERRVRKGKNALRAVIQDPRALPAGGVPGEPES
jgi:electron transfer flavoprotein alpha subunit